MKRSEFLKTLPFLPGLRAVPKSACITRIALTPITGRFHKFVALNSYDTAPKGETYQTSLARVQTDQGLEGIGAALVSDAPGLGVRVDEGVYRRKYQAQETVIA